MSEKPADTPAGAGRQILLSLWCIFHFIALMIGSVTLLCIGIALTTQPSPLPVLEQAFHIPCRHLDPSDFRRDEHHTLKVEIGSGYDEDAFVADLLQAGWQPRAEEQRPWRSFDRAGMTLRLFPGGLFALPTCLDTPDASTPTDLRTFHP